MNSTSKMILKTIFKIIVMILYLTFSIHFTTYLFSLTFFTTPSGKEVREVPYSSFENVISKTFKKNTEPYLVEKKNGNLYYYTDDIVYSSRVPDGTIKEMNKYSNRSENTSKILEKYNMPYKYYEFSWLMFFVLIFSVILLFAFFFLLLFLMDFRGRKKAQNELDYSNINSEKVFMTDLPKINLKDIGGLSPQVSEEINQAIMLFHNHKNLNTFKIKPINGILLYGPPGTGKTMLAKAIANEINAKYFQVNGPEFVERYVGVGPSRVRELFKEARKNQPSVVFIDEIDAIGMKRESENNSESRNTLNQLLIELSNIQNEQVLVMASTNHQTGLDPALVRSGRFDYKINIGLPDIKGRREIIEIKTKDIPMDKHLSDKLDDLSRSMFGMSGADIEDIFQKAQIIALQEERSYITYQDVQNGIDRIILGTRGRITHSEEIIKRIAYHESGHALLTSLLRPNMIQKVTIIPHSDILGVVLVKEEENTQLKTSKELMDQVCILLAGGLTEELYFNEHSLGVSQDYEQSKKIATNMVNDLGMTLEGFSFTTKSDSDKEIKKIINNCFEKTRQLLKQNSLALKKIAENLIEKETLTGDEVNLIVNEIIKQ
ncbi:AAA family ATPase [Bacillus mexicanus]|uniref:AAA family ATPase n=1 Tax=Bacillus mexicanus TaxID=2834415 RepID=UPI003D214205